MRPKASSTVLILMLHGAPHVMSEFTPNKMSWAIGLLQRFLVKQPCCTTFEAKMVEAVKKGQIRKQINV